MFGKALSDATFSASMPLAFAGQTAAREVALRCYGRLPQELQLVGKLKKLWMGSGPSWRHAMGRTGSASGVSPSFTSWRPS